MEFKDIDSMFDGAAKRMGDGVNPAASYGEPPLASDHYLLRRSWEFFQKRMKALEDQWEQIASAKDAEIRALMKAASDNTARLHELEERSTESNEMDRLLETMRLDEHRNHAAAVRALQEKWEMQREVLERRATDAEALAVRVRQEAESRLTALEKDARELRESLAKARGEIDLQVEKRLGGESEASESLLRRDDLIRSLESKVDLLRSELERREMMFKQTVEKLHALAHENERLSVEKTSAVNATRDAEQRAANLDERLRVARQEADELKSARKREQAEWRELWDRAREMWEAERSRRGEGHSPLENA